MLLLPEEDKPEAPSMPVFVEASLLLPGPVELVTDAAVGPDESGTPDVVGTSPEPVPLSETPVGSDMVGSSLPGSKLVAAELLLVAPWLPEEAVGINEETGLPGNADPGRLVD